MRFFHLFLSRYLGQIRVDFYAKKMTESFRYDHCKNYVKFGVLRVQTTVHFHPSTAVLAVDPLRFKVLSCLTTSPTAQTAE